MDERGARSAHSNIGAAFARHDIRMEFFVTTAEICNRNVVTALADDTLSTAAQRMRDRRVGSVVVIDSRRHPIGILTDRDIVAGPIADGAANVASVAVGAVMTRDVTVIDIDAPVEFALHAMRMHGVRRMPAVDASGEIAGIVTMDDLVRMHTRALADLVSVVQRERDHGVPVQTV